MGEVCPWLANSASPPAKSPFRRRRFELISPIAFPQYRIPIERLKEEWARRIAWQRMRRNRPPVPPSKITDNSEPWIRNPSSVAEFWEIACKINETVAKWAPRQENSSQALLEKRMIPDA